jgi:hypothetical protein
MAEIDANAGFKASLEEARQRLAKETALRDEAQNAVRHHEEEMVRLRRVIVSLANVVGEATEMEAIGITDACRAVMNDAVTPLKLRSVRDRLSQYGFDISTQANLDASVQVVLNRLADKKEIRKEVVAAPGGKQVVIYVGPKVKKLHRDQMAREIATGQS